MDELTERLWESQSINARYEAYKAEVGAGSIEHTQLENPLLKLISPTIETRMSELRAEAAGEDGRTKGWKWAAVALKPEVAADVAASAIVNAMCYEAERSYRELMNRVAKSIRLQIAFEYWFSDNKEEGREALKFMDKRLSKMSRQAASQWRKRFYKQIDDYLREERDVVGLKGTQVAAYIVDHVMQEHSDIFQVRYKMNKAQSVSFTREFLEDADRYLLSIATSSPESRPMLVPPLPWRYDEEAGFIRGGYLMIDEPVYQASMYKHEFYPSNEALAALNEIQSTPWRINQRAYNFCRQLQQSSSALFPRLPENDLVVFLSEFEWDALSEDERRDIRQESRDRREAWASQAGKARTMIRKLTLAEQLMKAGNVFYQPHRFDFRGRVYPINAELSSQSDSWAKGLMQFHEGRELGEEGLTNLAIHLANCWGQDKLSLDGRVDFVNTHITDWRIAIQSFEGQCLLASQADEPLPFLAALWELDEALRLPDPGAYVSHIPVAVDGTCNGLQILSLMGHDKVGAKATNCTSDPERHDLYSEVSDEVQRRMREILYRGPSEDEEIDAANAWQLKMLNDGRKVVKRAVMTTPYGVTDQGIVEQLVKDGHCDDLEIPERWDMTIHQGRNRLARYMAKWIITARAEVVREAMKIMTYFRDTTAVLAEHGKHLAWRVHDGCEVEQRYSKMRLKESMMYDRGKKRKLLTPTQDVDVRKSQGGSAPNVVHSLDAAMLRSVARRMYRDGITSMAMIHDSYACHAAGVDRMQAIIRLQAIDMFRGDWLLTGFYAHLLRQYPELEHELPEPPAQGDLNVAAEVRAATYFFS